MLREFRDFLTKTNALALAIGVIIGAAVAKLVSAVADDVLMPIVGLVLPSGNWRNAKFVLSGQNAILYGHLLGSVIDFVIIAAVVFLVLKALIKPAPAPATKTCPECLETIPADARRCRACSALLAGERGLATAPQPV